MSTIYVRITLLTLATTMFGMIWSHDHKPVIKQKTVVALDFDQPCAMKTFGPVIQRVSWQQLDEEIISLSDKCETSINETAIAEEIQQVSENVPEITPQFVQVSQLSFPVPHDLAVGDYRVIDQFGEVHNLSVTADQRRDWGLSDSNSPQNSYEILSQDHRWHFIKIEEPTEIVAENYQPGDVEMEEAWGSVLNYAGQAIAPAVQKVASPLKNWLGQDIRLSAEPAIMN